jgi:hypothetical protein
MPNVTDAKHEKSGGFLQNWKYVKFRFCRNFNGSPHLPIDKVGK